MMANQGENRRSARRSASTALIGVTVMGAALWATLAGRSPDSSVPVSVQWSEMTWTVFSGIPARVLLRWSPDFPDEGKTRVKSEIEKMFGEIDQTFNAFKPTSLVSEFNRSPAHQVVKVSPLFTRAVELGAHVTAATGGAFDLSVWPLKELWSRAAERQIPPTREEIRAAAANVGPDVLTRLSEGEVMKNREGAALDFGGLVKGSVVDRIVDFLKRNGVTDGLVQCGGEIRAFGRNRQGGAWRLGVQDPLRDGEVVGHLAPEEEIALSTSGNYRQPIRIGETTYYHIFNPATGEPVSTDVLGVTVWVKGGPDSNALADAYATAMTALGPARGMELAQKLGFEALFVVKSDRPGENDDLVMTDGFRRVFQRVSPGRD